MPVLDSVFPLTPSANTTFTLLAYLIPVLGILIATNIMIIRSKAIKGLYSILVGYLIVGLVFGACLIPQLYFSKIVVGEGFVEAYVPGIIPLHRKVFREHIENAYICDVDTCLGGFSYRTWGTSIGNFAVGYFKLPNGKEAYVASIDSHGENLIIELKDGTYLVLKPSDFKEFLKVFSSKIMKIKC